MPAAKKPAPKITEDAPKPTGATSGVFALGKVGKAARQAAHEIYGGGKPPAQPVEREPLKR